MGCQYAQGCEPPDGFLPTTGFDAVALLVLFAVLAIALGIAMRMRAHE